MNNTLLANKQHIVLFDHCCVLNEIFSTYYSRVRPAHSFGPEGNKSICGLKLGDNFVSVVHNVWFISKTGTPVA